MQQQLDNDDEEDADWGLDADDDDDANEYTKEIQNNIEQEKINVIK